MNVAFATGADSKLFLNLCILADSFATHNPHRTLHICDFGLTAPHRGIFAATGHLREAPAHLADEPHTWRRKAALTDYFTDADESVDAVVWFDADMLVLDPVCEEIEDIAHALIEAQESVAVCTDSNGDSIAGFIAANEGPGIDLTPFETLLGELDSDMRAAYLNTGFFIIRPGAFAEDWARRTAEQPDYLLFEQNTFNALARAPGAKVRALDPAIWNVHGELLADVETNGAAHILHATSKGAHHTQSRFSVPLGETEIVGDLKILVRPDLMKLQADHLMHFLLAHQDTVTSHWR